MNQVQTVLTDKQIEQYWKDGFVYGIPVLTPEQMAIARGKLVTLEGREIETDPKRWLDTDYQPWHDRGSDWWHWFQGMAKHPTIINAAKSILGPNVMIRNADIFIKPIGSEETIQWHSDTAASSTDADNMLTAWIAISESNKKNGCMEWITGSHRAALPPEIKNKYSLSYNSESAKAVRHKPREANILQPGQMSLHHFRTIHRSHYNRTKAPRIGLVIRFMSTETPLEVAESGKGTLVSGANIPGHFGSVPTFHVSWKRHWTAQPASTPPAKRLWIV